MNVQGLQLAYSRCPNGLRALVNLKGNLEVLMHDATGLNGCLGMGGMLVELSEAPESHNKDAPMGLEADPSLEILCTDWFIALGSCMELCRGEIAMPQWA